MQETQVWSLGWEDPLGEGNGNTFQYSCLGNPMDREASWATVHGIIRVRHDLVTKPPPSKILSSCHMLSGEPLHSKGKKMDLTTWFWVSFSFSKVNPCRTEEWRAEVPKPHLLRKYCSGLAWAGEDHRSHEDCKYQKNDKWKHKLSLCKAVQKSV